MTCEIGYFEAWQQWVAGNSISDCYLWGLRLLWWGRIGKLIQLVSALTIIADILGPERLDRLGTDLSRFNTSKKKLFDDLKKNFCWIEIFIEGFLNYTEKSTDESDCKEAKYVSFIKIDPVFNKIYTYSKSSFKNFLSVVITSSITTFTMASYLGLLNGVDISMDNLDDNTNFFREVYVHFCMYKDRHIGNLLTCGLTASASLILSSLGIFIMILLLAVGCFGVSLLVTPFVIFFFEAIILLLVYFMTVFLFKPLSLLLRLEDCERWISLASLIFLLIGFHIDFLGS